jgi:thiol-disulfide isomerase/thioredoxin
MKSIYLIISALIGALVGQAQTVAMDFTQNDCNGNPIHLFEILDQNSVVIIEFFMDNCSPCINAGNELLPHFTEMQAAYPGHVEWFHFGFTDSYTCETVLTWVADNGFPSRPFTNGAEMVAYYGGFGMPTIVVLAGVNHEIIYSEVGYSSGDDNLLHTAIDEFFASSPLAIQENELNNFVFNTTFISSLELLKVNLPARNDQFEIAVYSLDGKLIVRPTEYTITESNPAISIPTNVWNNGSYIVTVRSGEKLVSKQINLSR